MKINNTCENIFIIFANNWINRNFKLIGTSKFNRQTHQIIICDRKCNFKIYK